MDIPLEEVRKLSSTEIAQFDRLRGVYSVPIKILSDRMVPGLSH